MKIRFEFKKRTDAVILRVTMYRMVHGNREVSLYDI